MCQVKVRKILQIKILTLDMYVSHNGIISKIYKSLKTELLEVNINY